MWSSIPPMLASPVYAHHPLYAGVSLLHTQSQRPQLRFSATSPTPASPQHLVPLSRHFLSPLRLVSFFASHFFYVAARSSRSPTQPPFAYFALRPRVVSRWTRHDACLLLSLCCMTFWSRVASNSYISPCILILHAFCALFSCLISHPHCLISNSLKNLY